MWIVKLALRRPYTFVVAALLIVVLGVLVLTRMPTDLLPNIDIPVVSAIWQYRGLSADEMAKRITMPSERSFTTTVNDIEHIESHSMAGVGVIKVFFHPGTAVDAAVAQMTAISQTVTRQMPPGTTPPLIIRFNASSVPILQLGLGGRGLSEQALFDIGSNFLRTGLATVQGASLLQPAGGRARQIMVDLDPKALYALGLSPLDVSAAIAAQSPILPAGTAKIGEREYSIQLNNSLEAVALLNEVPVRQQGAATIRVRDVAQVRDGGAVQTNIVRQDGRRGALVSVLKTGRASTLDIVNRVKQELPRILSTLPPELDVRLLLDQSVFVRAAISSVVREGVLAAVLTALMILLFIGSWRSTLIVSTSIPLSILSSLILLYFLGYTIDVMTLGGLALAIGILVDEAIVAIENIHRHLAMGKSMVQGVLDGAGEIAIPAFVSFLTISIVFAPVVLLRGTAKYLFQPLAMAVVFAMLASYLLSRTLVPTMVRYMLAAELSRYGSTDAGHGASMRGPIWRVHHAFMRGFGRFQASYGRRLSWALAHPRAIVIGFAIVCAGSGVLATQLGQDFFPQVDAGQLRLHVRTPVGSRLETAEQLFARVEDYIRSVIPPETLDTIVDNIGLPVLPINIAYSDSATIGAADGEILISLSSRRRRGETWAYARRLREELPRAFPGLTFFFRPADMVSQILNFGIPAPIDVQVMGRSPANHGIARTIERQLRQVPGAADVRLHQIVDAPALQIDVDRIRAAQMGLTQRDVATSVLTSLSSSGQVSPAYWLDPVTGVSYLIAVQTPEHRVASTDDIRQTPLAASRSLPPQLLANVATIRQATSPMVVSQYNVQPVLDVYAGVQDRDLGSVATEVDRIVAEARRQLPRGSIIQVRGQMETMRTSFLSLSGGLILAVMLVYLVMVINFQSWLDPFIILTALPGAFSGIVWSLYLTQTTINVPSLMGAIMSVGVATANSILLVTFAKQQQASGAGALEAAHAAAMTRLRPVLMTAGAMILGMLPMSLGLGEGGEQNAPIGIAVIGGLLVATVATLVFVPVAYSLLRAKAGRTTPEADLELLV